MLAGAAQGEPAEETATPCAAAIQEAEARYATPSGLLGSIAKTESGRPVPPDGRLQAWPWTVNVAGVGRHFETQAAAVGAVRRALAINAGNVDVGCMQVSLQHHPDAFPSLEEAFDPAANVDYAARFLLNLREAAGGNWYIAAGLYHSHTPELARLYRQRITLAGSTVRALGPREMRIVLANGRVLTINTTRQPARFRRHRSACEVAAILGPYLAANARAGACVTAKPTAR
jgi:hypothetical protein